MIKILFCLMLLAGNLILAQSNHFSKEAELQKFVERGGKYEETSPNIYKLTYSDGTQKLINLNNPKNQNNFIERFENTIINVWEIDTTLYANRFIFWQRVDIVNAYEGIVFVEDLNKNGLLELYGYSEENYPFVGPVVIFEQDDQGIFNNVYSYDFNSAFVQGIGDIDSDGKMEIHLRTIDTLNGKFYKADSLNLLPTQFDFIFYYYPLGQINDMTFGDLDNNGITDCAFIDWPTIFISEYNFNIINFTTIFEYLVNDYSSGFAIGDFDQDRKTELIFGTSLQQVYVIEAMDTSQYSVIWQGLAPTYNVYMVTKTNDIDSNGKPEFWIGGQDFNTGISTFWCYEADGDNNYVAVAGIELRYLVTLDTDYLQSSDVNNDGKDELVINLGNYLLILNFIGKPNQHSYEIYYAKIEELSQPGANFRPVTIADLNNDGKKDLLLPMDKYLNPNTELFSYLLIQDSVSIVIDDNSGVPDKFNLSQNFPNPFNPVTKIKYSISQSSFVVLKIYDILGNEIETIVNEEKPSGFYEVEFDASNISSGIYFYQLQAGDFISTKKLVLIK